MKIRPIGTLTSWYSFDNSIAFVKKSGYPMRSFMALAFCLATSFVAVSIHSFSSNISLKAVRIFWIISRACIGKLFNSQSALSSDVCRINRFPNQFLNQYHNYRFFAFRIKVFFNEKCSYGHPESFVGQFDTLRPSRSFGTDAKQYLAKNGSLLDVFFAYTHYKVALRLISTEMMRFFLHIPK